MAISTYKAQLNYYDPTYGWGNEGTTCQGNWTDAGGNRTGVMYFPGLSALKDKIINSVKLKVTTGKTGNNASKTAKFYASANQGGIKTSLKASHKTGSSIGSVTGTMYNNSSEFTITFLSSHIAAGEDTFCIYDTGTTNYLKWSAVTLEIDWSEPATQPTLNKTSVVMQDGTVTISTPASNSAYRHTLRYVFGSAKGTIATNVASAYEWTPPISLAKQIPSAVSGSGTIYCDTYSGDTLLGTKSVAITLTVPSSVVPSAGTLKASVTDDTSGTGLYVKGMGKARVQLTGAAGAQGSTIKSTKITGGGWTENDADMTTGVLTKSGSITFSATVTDSRGRTSAAVTCTIEVLNYSKPGITACKVYRCDSTGAKKNAGTYAAIEINASYSTITGNSLSIKAAYKLDADSDYGTAVNLTNGGKTIIGGGALSSSKTYSIRITIADKYNELELVYPLSTRKVIRSILKGIGIAFGKVAEIAGLDVGFAARFRDTVRFDNPYFLTDDGEQEWLLPPMESGVEYRTTERWQGKAVYTKAMDFGALPASGTKNLTLLTSVYDIIDWRVNLISGTGANHTIPWLASGTYEGKIRAAILANNNRTLQISVAEDMSAYSATVVIKYVKD